MEGYGPTQHCTSLPLHTSLHLRRIQNVVEVTARRIRERGTPADDRERGRQITLQPTGTEVSRIRRVSGAHRFIK